MRGRSARQSFSDALTSSDDNECHDTDNQHEQLLHHDEHIEHEQFVRLPGQNRYFTFFLLATTSASTTTAGAIIYSQTFTGGVASNAQCTPWTAFVAQLIARPYTLLTMYGTFDPTGVTVTDPTIIANIAAALRTSTSYGPVTTNSRSWVVGACGGGYELSASGTTCQCTTPGYILRPCINHADYGGVNSTTCSGPTQTMTVVFQ